MKELNIRPLFDTVIIDPEKEVSENSAGVILPISVKDVPQRGTVMAIGGQVTEFKKGDTVLYARYSENKLDISGSNYLIMRESDIFAIVTE